jgi:hypothetical protein
MVMPPGTTFAAAGPAGERKTGKIPAECGFWAQAGVTLADAASKISEVSEISKVRAADAERRIGVTITCQ